MPVPSPWSQLWQTVAPTAAAVTSPSPVADSDGGPAQSLCWCSPGSRRIGHTWAVSGKSAASSTSWKTFFADHDSIAAWHWDDDIGTARVQRPVWTHWRARKYCVQYRESDLDLCSACSLKKGLSWRVEEDAEAPGGHTVVIFLPACANPKTPPVEPPWAAKASGSIAAAARKNKTASRPLALGDNWAKLVDRWAPLYWAGTMNPTAPSWRTCPPTTSGAAQNPVTCKAG